MTVTGLQQGPYALTLNATSSDGTAQPMISIPGIAGVGSISSFQVQYTSLAGSAVTLSRIATFQSILADINNSLALNLIDNAGIANSLTRKIQEAARAASEHESDDAKEALNAFKHQVSAQTGKHITGVAPQVLLEEATSLISQLP
jgi:hypothetical protein